MSFVQDYLTSNKDRFLEELIDFLKIPSISADSAYKEDVNKAADWLIIQFGKLDMDRVEKLSLIHI